MAFSQTIHLLTSSETEVFVFFPQVKKHFLQKYWQYALLKVFNSRKADKTLCGRSLSLCYVRLARK